MNDTLRNSEKYLNEIVKKNSFFTVPKNYFDTVEKDIETKIIEEEIIKEHGFQIPDSYFEKLTSNILSKTTLQKEPTIISLNKKRIKLAVISVAATIVLFIGFYYSTFKNQTSTLEMLTENDIEYWLESNVINPNDITIVFEDYILKEEVFSLSSLDYTQIKEYILNTNIQYINNY